MSPAAASAAASGSAQTGAAQSGTTQSSSTQPAENLNQLISEAAKDLADYQRLTAEGKLGEAGQKLEQLKRALEKLNARPR